ncbi:MFS transporter [Prevotella histicola]|uniref:Major facilitator transporter n=1 Tax=Prevotella histicola JCM 15637 = DNF00424 TaxID=1236504 RepID=A0AAW3FDF6_9BACT|nr:MFS transporter [Prevotella histicola]KGF25497.1 major facilitator transporter [Prevotella histicola JCM 15637 = DNF00424]
MEINSKTENKNIEQTAFGILLTVSFCHLLDDTMHSMLPAIYPMLKDEFGLSFLQIGIITFVLQITSSIIQPFVGLYADKHHSWWQLPVSMIFTLIGIFMLSYANSFYVILLSVSLFGLGSSIFHPQGSQVAQQASGGRKGLAQSIFQVGGNGGFALGPLFAALIVIPVGLSGIRWFAFIAILLAIILVYIGKWHVKQTKKVHKKSRTQWTTAKTYCRYQIYGFVFILFVLMFSKNFYTESMTSYFTFFLIEKFGISIQYSQVCLFVFLAAEVVGTLLGGWIGDRYGRKNVIWFSIFGAAPFTIMLPYISSLAGTILLSALIGLIIASAFSAILVYATDLMPNHIGTIAGIFYGLSFGLGGVGSSFFGWLADQTSILFVFKVSTLLPLLGIIALYLPKMKRE